MFCLRFFSFFLFMFCLRFFSFYFSCVFFCYHKKSKNQKNQQKRKKTLEGRSATFRVQGLVFFVTSIAATLGRVPPWRFFFTFFVLLAFLFHFVFSCFVFACVSLHLSCFFFYLRFFFFFFHRFFFACVSFHVFCFYFFGRRAAATLTLQAD